MRSAASLLFLIIISVHNISSAQTAKQILTDYFDAIGGIENIKKFKSAAHNSIHIQYFPKLDTIRVDLIAKAPHSFNFRSFRKGDLQYEAFGNEHGQTMFMYHPYPNKLEKEKTVVPLTTSHELLTAFQKNKIKRLADTTINEMNAFSVRSTFAQKGLASNRTYYFNKVDHRLIGFSSEAIEGDFNSLDRYTDIDGVLVPLQSRYTVKGKLLTEYFIENFRVNPALHDSLFIAKAYHSPAKNKLRLNRNIEFLDPHTGEQGLATFLKQFSGKIVLLDLWASWCGPCKDEFSAFDDGYFHFLKSKNIEIVYVSFDKSEKEHAWKTAIDDFVLTGKHIRAGKKLQQSIQHEFSPDGTMYIPRLILIGPDGKVLSPELPKLSSGFFYTKVNELVK